MSKVHPLRSGGLCVYSQQHVHVGNNFLSPYAWTQQTHNNPSRTGQQNKKSTFLLQYIGFLTILRDLGTIIGASLFSIGALLGFSLAHGYFPLRWSAIFQLFQSIMTLLGAIFFTITPAATFILTDAISYQNKELVREINGYILGGLFFFLGAIVYSPFRSQTSTRHDHTMGAFLYLIGSVMYVVVTASGMYRALALKEGPRTSSFIESWVPGLYLVGAFMFLAGSIFSFPAKFSPYCYAMFFVGEQCFIVGSVAILLSQGWGHVQKHQMLLYMRASVLWYMMWTASTTQAVLTKGSANSSILIRGLWHFTFRNSRRNVAKKYNNPTAAGCQNIQGKYENYNM